MSVFEITIDNNVEQHSENLALAVPGLPSFIKFAYNTINRQVFIHNDGTVAFRWGYNGVLMSANTPQGIGFATPTPLFDMLVIAPDEEGYFSTTGKLNTTFNVIGNNVSVLLHNITIYVPEGNSTTIYSLDMNNVAFENVNQIKNWDGRNSVILRSTPLKV